MDQKKISSLTGTGANPDLKALIMAKIQQLQESEDPNDLESLEFWKAKLAEHEND